MSTAPQGQIGPIEIFRPGRHTAMDGRTIAFSAEDVAATAAAYDPARWKAPLVLGHPQSDQPAYGWVDTLTSIDGSLEAAVSQIDPEFAEKVRVGRYRHVSASFYAPRNENNPVPGTYYLKHIGFLGAMPPAIKGLRPVQFAEADGTAEFVMPLSASIIVRALRNIREFIIGLSGQQQADATLPSNMIDTLAAVADAEAAAAADPAIPAYSEPKQETPSVADTEAAARAAQLQQREVLLQQREAAFAEREAAQRRTENAAWFDGLVREGRALPANRALVLAFMERLDAAEAVSFGEGQPQTEAAAFRALLAAYPKLVEFREVAGGDGVVLEEGAAAQEIERASIAYQEAMRLKGITVTNIEAIKAVTGKGNR
jgi:hypothetical protein